MTKGYVAIVTGLIALLAGAVVAQNTFPTLMADQGLFTEGQLGTLQRDADLAQRAGVPIMFVVVRGDGTSAGSAQRFADEHRAEYAVETTPGADDGIVFLTHWIPDNPSQSTVVYSAGTHAFETTGLNDETITSYITDTVQPWLNRGQVFEANAYLMRYTRYTGLYVPPPVKEITGTARAVQRVLTIVAPILALTTVVAMWSQAQPSDRQRWQTVVITFVAIFVLAVLSIWTHSRIGIVSLIAIMVSLSAWCIWVTRKTSRQAIPWRAILPDALIVVVLVGISLSINLQQVEVTPGDRDETRWINRAYYAADLRDPFGPTWQDYAVTVGQPPLGSIAIGIGMALQGKDLRTTGVWDYQYDRAWFIATGGYPTDESLSAGRTTNAVIGAMATGTTYVLGRLMTNRIGGIAAGAYLAWHPLHIVLSTQALSDETFALMLLLALIAGWQFATKPTWTRAIVLGVLLGLGGATKLTPLLLAPPLAVLGLIRLGFDRSAEGKRAGRMLMAQPIIAFAAFVAVYPWLWPNPIERTWRLFSFRSGEMDAQTNAWPNALTENPFEALARFGYKLTYTHSTSQKALQSAYDWIGIDRVAVGFDLVLAAAGAVMLLWIITRRGLWTPHALIGCMLFGELAILAIGMKADFYRYHLPVVMIVSACLAMAVGTTWSFLFNLAQRRNTVTSASISPEVAT